MTRAIAGMPGLAGPVPKQFRGGTHRTVSPAQTVERVRPYMPVMGITRVANITGLDRVGIPVVMVCRPNSRSLAVSQGKGLDLPSARASGLMESVEAWHAERITLPLKLGSYEELRYTHRLVDVDLLPRLESSIFHRDLPLLWIEGFDLLRGEPAWVPYELVHTNYTLPLPTGAGCFAPSSNGLASGNHLLEAISHAICEVIERDATALWTLLDEARQQASRVHLDTVDDPGCREVLDKYARTGVSAAVWETTSEVGVPSFMCIIAEREEDRLRGLHAAAGYGCHPVRHVALLRALTEAAQSRLTVIAGSRDDFFRRDYERSRNPDVRRRDRALLSEHDGMLRFAAGPSFDGDTLDEDVEWLLCRLRVAGFEQAVVVDLTRPEFGIPVVRAVIPGMEGPITLEGYRFGRRARARMEGGA